ncbi:glycosyltransferase family 2 protein [Symmachiella dynata]|uniref:glycosyltransferase family 2 protein n=1 Tax=Symmachiella dynata TaxID=2527995 RepID=UPI0030ED3F2D
MPPRVSVVIVAYRGKAWLPDCVGSMRCDCHSPMHLILVDNDGENEIDALPLEDFQHTILKTPRAMGFAEANNFALQAIGLDSEYACFLNQDTRSEPGWIAACLECFERHPSLGAVTPLLMTYDGEQLEPNALACGRQSAAFCEAEATNDLRDRFFEVPEIPATAMIVRSDVLRQVGPFDPIFGSYYEDYDLCHRIREAGYSVGICTAGRVAHYCGSATTTEKSNRRRMRQIIRNRAIYRCRSAGTHRLGSVGGQFFRTLPHNLCRGLFRTPSSQPVWTTLSAHWDMLFVLRRLMSAKNDRAAWNAYLDEIGWRNDRMQHTNPPQFENVVAQ